MYIFLQRGSIQTLWILTQATYLLTVRIARIVAGRWASISPRKLHHNRCRHFSSVPPGHMYTYTNTNTCIQTYIHTYKHTCVRTYVHTCIHLHNYTLWASGRDYGKARTHRQDYILFGEPASGGHQHPQREYCRSSRGRSHSKDENLGRGPKNGLIALLSSTNSSFLFIIWSLFSLLRLLSAHIYSSPDLTPVAGLIFETKNRAIFLERFFWRDFSGAALLPVQLCSH